MRFTLPTPQRSTIPAPIDDKTRALLATVRKANSRQRFFNAAVFLGMVAIALGAILLSGRSSAQDEAIVDLVGSLRQTCEQVDNDTLPLAARTDCDRIQNGQVPIVVERLGQVGATGPAGAPGAAGPPGRTGVAIDGLPGLPGAQGLPGEPGASPPCLETPAMCQGADGAPGAPGVDGATGPSGRDGTDGLDGVAGQDGEPPVSWTATLADGSIQTCARVDDFDRAAPRYSCTVSGGQSDGEPGVVSG